MPAPFAWFDATSSDSTVASTFFNAMFGWQGSPADGSTMLTQPDDEMPFAATVPASDDVTGWVPYMAVDDVDAATEKAIGLGATLIRERTKGPAGFYTVVAIPGGPPLALWKFG